MHIKHFVQYILYHMWLCVVLLKKVMIITNITLDLNTLQVSNKRQKIIITH